MKALALTDFDNAPALNELPVPEVASGQVRIRVGAAGLNKIDTAIGSGMLQGMAEYQFPVVLGRDAAGVVDAVGDGVDHVSVGDEVIGHVLLGPTLHDGTLAEYALVPADAVVAKPDNLDFTAAAALPLAGAAALAAVDAVEPSPGARVLIAGAGGGVGSYAVQLAASRGATVIATGLPDDADRLRDLGAAEVVDYRDDVAAQVLTGAGGPVDALIDLVSFDADSLDKLAATVRHRGKVASTLNAASPEALAPRGLVATNIMATPTRETLTTLVDEIQRGALRVDVEQTMSLDEATTGLETLANGQARGKIVVTLDN
jgi:NADPH:quinone reductase-like Zn-dependent oxidoreductase